MRPASGFTLSVALLIGICLGSARDVAAQRQSREKTYGHQQQPSGYLGLLVQYDSVDDSGALEYPVVVSVEVGSPAQQAGLAAGDTIMGYDDIDARANPMGLIRLLIPSRKVLVHYRRNGLHDVPVTVGRRKADAIVGFSFTVTPDNGSMRSSIPAPTSPLAPVAIMAPLAARGDVPVVGANITRMNAGLAAAMNVPNAGMLVTEVVRGTPAEESGLQGGDVIVAADGTPVTAISVIFNAMYAKTARGEHSVTLDILRKGKAQKLNLHW